MNITGNARYIDILPAIVENYNASVHHTIMETPTHVHFCSTKIGGVIRLKNECFRD